MSKGEGCGCCCCGGGWVEDRPRAERGDGGWLAPGGATEDDKAGREGRGGAERRLGAPVLPSVVALDEGERREECETEGTAVGGSWVLVERASASPRRRGGGRGGGSLECGKTSRIRGAAGEAGRGGDA